MYRNELNEIVDNIREKSMLKNSSFSEIYEDPLSYVRVLDKEQLENESNYPAYIAHKKSVKLPKRLLDSRLMKFNEESVSFILI